MPRGTTAALALLVSLSASAQTAPDYIERYKKEGLPKPPPVLQTDPSRAIPIPKDAKSLGSSTPSVTPLGTDTDRAEIEQVLRTIQASDRAKAALGSSSQLVAGGRLPPALDKSEGTQYLMTYYDYARERAVEIVVKGTEVVDVRERERGYQPPPSPEELRAAASLVDRAWARTADLNALRGLAYAGSEGQRRIYLDVMTPQGRRKATVELSTKRVLQVQ